MGCVMFCLARITLQGLQDGLSSCGLSLRGAIFIVNIC